MPGTLPGRVPKNREIAPEFELPDSTGTPRGLSELVSQGPLALVFFRGHW